MNDTSIDATIPSERHDVTLYVTARIKVINVQGATDAARIEAAIQAANTDLLNTNVLAFGGRTLAQVEATVVEPNFTIYTAFAEDVTGALVDRVSAPHTANPLIESECVYHGRDMAPIVDGMTVEDRAMALLRDFVSSCGQNQATPEFMSLFQDKATSIVNDESKALFSDCITWKHARRPMWASVLPEPGKPGTFRVLRFDSNGFSGHSCFSSKEAALTAAQTEDYTVPDSSALARLSETREFQRGNLRTELGQQFYSGEISADDFRKRLEDFNAR